jgi:hypothetical protein
VGSAIDFYGVKILNAMQIDLSRLSGEIALGLKYISSMKHTSLGRAKVIKSDHAPLAPCKRLDCKGIWTCDLHGFGRSVDSITFLSFFKNGS